VSMPCSNRSACHGIPGGVRHGRHRVGVNVPSTKRASVIRRTRPTTGGRRVARRGAPGPKTASVSYRYEKGRPPRGMRSGSQSGSRVPRRRGSRRGNTLHTAQEIPRALHLSPAERGICASSRGYRAAGRQTYDVVWCHVMASRVIAADPCSTPTRSDCRAVAGWRSQTARCSARCDWGAGLIAWCAWCGEGRTLADWDEGTPRSCFVKVNDLSRHRRAHARSFVPHETRRAFQAYDRTRPKYFKADSARPFRKPSPIPRAQDQVCDVHRRHRVRDGVRRIPTRVIDAARREPTMMVALPASIRTRASDVREARRLSKRAESAASSSTPPARVLSERSRFA
jgi:hypothetical protein